MDLYELFGLGASANRKVIKNIERKAAANDCDDVHSSAEERS